MLWLCACGSGWDPPPDIDTETGGGGTEGGPSFSIVFDGEGLGEIRPARFRDTPEIMLEPLTKHGLVIGAPDEAWEGLARSGQVSLVLDDGTGGLAPPSDSPSTYVEENQSQACWGNQSFAWIAARIAVSAAR